MKKIHLGRSSKYGATKTNIDGVIFDSRHEAERYLELKIMERQRLIKDLQCQVPFELIPAQYEKDGNKRGKCIERECIYKADFVYTEGNALVVEDAKGYRTKDYIIKRKLMLQKYGIRIREV